MKWRPLRRLVGAWTKRKELEERERELMAQLARIEALAQQVEREVERSIRERVKA